MKRLSICLLALFCVMAFSSLAAEPLEWKLKVGELDREVLVYLPSKPSDAPVPVVFGFHGHGGNARNAARTFHFQDLWPEAIVVYMQGIPTPGRLTDPEGKRNGWQHNAGDLGDRDLKFFDAVLARLRQEHRVDDRRIYATGHSNGGGFTYLLWAQRHEVFAAMAPSAAGGRSVLSLKPKPAMHLAGEKDALVKYEIQQRVMAAVLQINGCEKTGAAWAKQATIYSSRGGTPFITFIHPGGHAYPQEAPPLIVRFFKEHSLPPPETKR